jgi:hypothetical protein
MVTEASSIDSTAQSLIRLYHEVKCRPVKDYDHKVYIKTDNTGNGLKIAWYFITAILE